jgi:hypothetical protein
MYDEDDEDDSLTVSLSFDATRADRAGELALRRLSVDISKTNSINNFDSFPNLMSRAAVFDMNGLFQPSNNNSDIPATFTTASRTEPWSK